MKQNTKWAALAMILACVVWGFSPLYYSLLTHVVPAEVLAHRTIWSFAIFGLVCVFTNRTKATVRSIKHRKTLGLICVAGVMIAINWYVFIYSVAAARVTESSLGYYFFPLFMVLLGWILFGERLTVLKWAAVGLAILAVAILTYGYGAVPWLALIITVTFAIYGIVKRVLQADPIVTVTLEVLVLLPIAIIYLASYGNAVTAHTLALLIFSGVITAGPLVLMSMAAQRLASNTIGMLQYLNPTLQFFSAVVILGEAFTVWNGAAITLIVGALVLYSVSAFRAETKVVSASATDAQT